MARWMRSKESKRALSLLTNGDKFYSLIEPYKRVIAIALPPAVRATIGVETTAAVCTNCIGTAVTNPYSSLAKPLNVAMVRNREMPYKTLARTLKRLREEDTRIGGILFVTTEHGACTTADAEVFMQKLVEASTSELRTRLDDELFGFYDGKEEERGDVGGSWRELSNTDDESGFPAASRVCANRLRQFLEKTQGALNTFG